MSVDEKSVDRVRRMIDRWSGVRGPQRSDEDRNSSKEFFLSRPRSEIVETQLTKIAENNEENGEIKKSSKEEVLVLGMIAFLKVKIAKTNSKISFLISLLCLQLFP